MSPTPGKLYDATLQEAIAAGLFHPNCAHDLNPYFPDLSPDQLPPRVDPAEQKLIDQHGYKKAQEIAYKAQQQQRYIERQIRNWKMKEVTALDPAEKAVAHRKVLDWQKAQRNHLAKNSFLPRKYEREAVKGWAQARTPVRPPSSRDAELERILRKADTKYRAGERQIMGEAVDDFAKEYAIRNGFGAEYGTLTGNLTKTEEQRMIEKRLGVTPERLESLRKEMEKEFRRVISSGEMEYHAKRLSERALSDFNLKLYFGDEATHTPLKRMQEALQGVYGEEMRKAASLHRDLAQKVFVRHFGGESTTLYRAGSQTGVRGMSEGRSLAQHAASTASGTTSTAQAQTIKANQILTSHKVIGTPYPEAEWVVFDL